MSVFRNVARVCIISYACSSMLLAAESPQRLSADQAKTLFATTSSEGFNTPFKPNTHSGARWYPDAGFGLFIHWGIHSVVPTNPSWSMIKNCFGKQKPANVPVEEYYKLSEQFNPQAYHPDEWMGMAQSMGMRYAVLTTKHHDGYCLWPSKYGDYNTKNGMDGRDLVKEYADSCRKHNLKVGFYFSPRDWGYNNHISAFGDPARGFDHNNKPVNPFSGEQNQIEYEKWLDYTIGQLSELLTQYGPVDVLWFDGAGWMGVQAREDEQRVRNWIYKLQPQIVINPRWGGKNINPDYDKQKGHHSLSDISRKVGDFYTYESKWADIEKRNEGLYSDIWFEFCKAWKGHWGYTPATTSDPDLKSMREIIHQLTELRSFGGNYLLNIGPSKDGEIRPDILAESKGIAEWMKMNGTSVTDTDAVKVWENYSNVPLTQKGSSVYAHVSHLAGGPNAVSITLPQNPTSVTYLHSGNQPTGIRYDKKSRKLDLEMDKTQADPLDLGTVIELKFATPTEFLK